MNYLQFLTERFNIVFSNNMKNKREQKENKQILIQQIKEKKLKEQERDNKLKMMNQNLLNEKRKDLAKTIIKDCINWLKSTIKNKKYIKYNKMINIRVTDYSDYGSVTFIDQQITDDWYYDLLYDCADYLNDKYKEDLFDLGMRIDTGDGDEGTIYIEGMIK